MKAVESYDNQGAQQFIEFLNSPSGLAHQDMLYRAFRGALGNDHQQKILDAASGPGWLAGKLKQEFPNTEACDGSEFFVDHVKHTYPGLKVIKADLSDALPYSENEFDVVCLSMAAQDLEDQPKTFAHINKIIKPGGKFLIAITNPYYAYPVGVWKRGIMGRLLGKKPKLKVRPYHFLAKRPRAFTFQKSIKSYFYTMAEYMNNILGAGFTLEKFQDLESPEDGQDFQYQTHRFPVILFMEFKKSRE